MLFHLADGAALLGIAVALIIGVYVHDAAQVAVAALFRDPLPRRDLEDFRRRFGGGLDPRLQKHLSPFSVVAMVIAGVGWTEPLRMNTAWRKRRFHVAAAILAGPIAYALLAFGTLAATKAVTSTVTIQLGDRVVQQVGPLSFTARLLLWMAITFAGMMIISLVPLPPVDGGRILFTLAPESAGWLKWRTTLEERNVGLAIILALLLLPVLFAGFPSVVGQLTGPLLRGLGGLIGFHIF